MITIIGTGHVFNLAEPVSFIVKNTWPDAVLIELDVSRYNALMKAQDEGAKPQGEQQMSAIYKQTARYQQRMSEEYDTQVGGEFLAAVNTGRLAGAAIIPIDTNAMQVLNDMWSEMSAMEKIRYKMSGISDSIGGKRKVESVQTSFAQDEERYIEGMRRKYPTLVRKLIDERNAHMAEQINKASETYSNMVVVVGDAHVEGICKLLKDQKVRKIRLADLRDRERMDRVREMVWKGDAERFTHRTPTPYARRPGTHVIQNARRTRLQRTSTPRRCSPGSSGWGITRSSSMPCSRSRSRACPGR